MFKIAVVSSMIALCSASSYGFFAKSSAVEDVRVNNLLKIDGSINHDANLDNNYITLDFEVTSQYDSKAHNVDDASFYRSQSRSFSHTTRKDDFKTLEELDELVKPVYKQLSSIKNMTVKLKIDIKSMYSVEQIKSVLSRYFDVNGMTFIQSSEPQRNTTNMAITESKAPKLFAVHQRSIDNTVEEQPDLNDMLKKLFCIQDKNKPCMEAVCPVKKEFKHANKNRHGLHNKPGIRWGMPSHDPRDINLHVMRHVLAEILSSHFERPVLCHLSPGSISIRSDIQLENVMNAVQYIVDNGGIANVESFNLALQRTVKKLADKGMPTDSVDAHKVNEYFLQIFSAEPTEMMLPLKKREFNPMRMMRMW